jgi:hypothetical protein
MFNLRNPVFQIARRSIVLARTLCGRTTSVNVYYQCALDPNRRAPAQRVVSGGSSMTAESFWICFAPKLTSELDFVIWKVSPIKTFCVAPKDKSLEAYKAWITELAERLTTKKTGIKWTENE